MESYADLMFTDAVQAEQEKLGVRDKYQHVYRNRFTSGLDEDAIAFIQSRTSFYIATVSGTGWPYVQHRGGPAGFLKIIAEDTLGFADYRGNKQLISKGNLGENDKVSLFLMDYPRRARLKLVGHATMIDAAGDPDLATELQTSDELPPERLVTIRIAAYDWNCPKYIEERFTRDEVTQLVAPHLEARDRNIAKLSDRLRALGEDPDALLEET